MPQPSLAAHFDQRYHRDSLKIGIVHLGIGAFHRAHQAFYTDRSLAREVGDWGICGVSLRSAAVREQLQPQQGLYTLQVLEEPSSQVQVLGAVKEVLFAPEQREDVLARMTHPHTKIVSLTVTEKGYCHDPATGRLNQQHPDVQHDLANPSQPKTVLGFLTEALRLRNGDGTPPFTVVSCDNLSENGALLRSLVVEFAALREAALAAWIRTEVAFPCSMVDRIVPATTESDKARIAALLGCKDDGCVVAEPFTQWVLEDRFPQGRPAWGDVGVEMVSDVRPFEQMKLRMLNGTHSTLAYLGFLAGHEFVYEAAAQPEFVRLLQEMWREEIIPTLSTPAETDLNAYAEALLARYQNQAVKYRLYQIATDGSQKMPPRLLETLRFYRERAQLPSRILLAIAGWMRFVTGVSERGARFEVNDPLAPKLLALAEASGFKTAATLTAEHAAAYVQQLLQVKEIFGEDLAQDHAVAEALTAHLRALTLGGVQAVLAPT